MSVRCFRVFPEALDPCFACFTLSHSSPCNAYQRTSWRVVPTLNINYANKDYIAKVLLTTFWLLIQIQSLWIQIPRHDNCLPFLERFNQKCGGQFVEYFVLYCAHLECLLEGFKK